MPSITRRHLLKLSLLGWALPFLPGCSPSHHKPPPAFDIPGEIIGESSGIGHLVRQPLGEELLPPPTGKLHSVVIVGGGVAGVSAGWKLARSGVVNFAILDLGDQLGGTSISGEANGTAFPWAAHYINTPPIEADCILEVLEELDVVVGYTNIGWPIMNPEYILRTPTERLFIDNRWVDGLDAFSDGTDVDRQTFMEFQTDMLRWTLRRGEDGRRAFTLPLEYSSAQPEIRALDGITMREYMRQKGWNSERLDWFVNYGCRDDYACPIDEVSAWAGIHYYACRYYADELQERFPVHTVTWPEGNAFLVNGMARNFSPNSVRLNALVLSIRQQGDEIHVTFMDTHSRRMTTLRAKAVIYAGQKHIAEYIIPQLPDEQRSAFDECQYTPWLTASIHLKHLPKTRGSEIAWDNVMYESEGLGYIVADHQTRKADPLEHASVVTYYIPFYRLPAEKRRTLLEKGHGFWVNEIMKDLWRMHPGIEKLITRIDLYKWGHAMIRPTPNFIWGPNREWRGRPFGRIFFANADVTGLPLFEEACYSGIRAAQQAMDALQIPYENSILD
ncbi:FAD-dependent oxidoreductase [Candidatus Poribacteria bacterium]|nr:FAD-dependent oxidoreductase [Candidatus Poribacteria bacterium]